ncbi:MAG: glycosyltransferase [Verrucomicrobia bacterium]|jgi:glycosyltransferase involved in cell wall biosynthesis|nr:glycosyltransferase [Verrucomicrobiota bacterium]
MNVVIIANAWGAGLDNPTSKHQIALELARQGHRVLWLEGAGMRKPSLGSGSDRGRIVRKLLAALRPASQVSGVKGQGSDGEIWILAPLLIPLPGKAYIRLLNSWIYFLAARFWCLLLGFRQPVLINYVPVLAEVERLWRRAEGGKLKAETGYRQVNDTGASAPSPQLSALSPQPSSIIYHCVDRWEAFGTYDTDLMRTLDRDCCVYADLVLATASDLYDRCKNYNANTHLLRHGVNHAHFAQALQFSEDSRPDDLPRGPIVGFFGLVSEWVDQDLLVELARALKGVKSHIVLIGKSDVDVARLQAEPTICLLGPKPFADLPRYVAHFDVGIIPFAINELTLSVNPIKLREMMAAGCPVVSTALPEVMRYAEEGRPDGTSPLVTVVKDAKGFVAGVLEMIVSTASHAERKTLSRSVEAESWQSQVAVLLRHISRSNL